jgi:hypothetical protein
MTEQEWLECEHPFPMIKECRQVIRLHPRKSRLFAVACCHRIWHLIEDERSRAAVEVAALFAEGLADQDQLKEAEEAARAAFSHAWSTKGEVGSYAEGAAQDAAYSSVWIVVESVCNMAFVAAGDGPKPGPEHTAQCKLLRCIFANPFRPVLVDTAWLAWNDRTVPKIAQAIYDERAFDRMPILADALEDAGCTDAEILTHCRGEGPHARGCWVVDLILGKQ